MIKTMSTKPLQIACALALAAMSGATPAQTYPPAPGYVTSSDGTVVKSGTGLCVYADTGNTYLPVNPCVPKPATVSMTEVVAPEPVVPPAPVAATPPAAPALAHLTLDADALFDFDKSTLLPAGQAALDDFVAKVRGINAGTITAVGYTDRIGTDDYNQHLSDRRAETVRAYLQDKGIEPGNLHAEGRGDTQPVTKPGECAGSVSAQVIACLQPDRRVEVEVSGTTVALLSNQ
jgi:OOP family OmpA-OmpF porin